MSDENKTPGVSRDANAFYDPVHGALPAWRKMIDRVENFLASHNMNFQIDEIALAFDSRHRRYAWLEGALQEEGVEAFNFAHDSVDTSPITSHYHVDYTFLRSPIEGVRLEIMQIQSGFSPLHAALMHEIYHNDPVVVHFSFKTKDEDHYEACVDRLSRIGGMLAQECESTYGKFSYWKFKDQDFSGVYIKPRVNRRDAQPITDGISAGEVHEAITHPSQRSHLRALDDEVNDL